MNEVLNVTLKDAFTQAGLRPERWGDLTEAVPARIDAIVRDVANELEHHWRLPYAERRALARRLRKVVQLNQLLVAYSFILVTPAPVAPTMNGHDLTPGVVTAMVEVVA
jgi:hypothetical protein